MSSKYPNEPESALAAFLIAESVYNGGEVKAGSSDEKNKYAWRDAKAMLEAIIKKFPASEGGIKAHNLLVQILHRSVSITVEKANVPGKAFRSLVSYRNTGHVYFRVIRITDEQRKAVEENNYDYDQRFTKLTRLNALKNWKQPLPSTDDFREHYTEVKIDALPVGSYALLSSVEEGFGLGQNPMAVVYFDVSNISFVNSKAEYFILHRETGKPLAGAKVQVWVQHYDYSKRQNVFEKSELLYADKNGYIKLTSTKNTEGSIRLEITHGADKYFPSTYFWSYQYSGSPGKDPGEKKFESDHEKIYLFTDRSIYRPGQQVFFKGIGITTDHKTRRPKILAAGTPLKALLFDANGQAVDSLALKLNEYGSMHASFRLPDGKIEW